MNVREGNRPQKKRVSKKRRAAKQKSRHFARRSARRDSGEKERYTRSWTHATAVTDLSAGQSQMLGHLRPVCHQVFSHHSSERIAIRLRKPPARRPAQSSAPPSERASERERERERERKAARGEVETNFDQPLKSSGVDVVAGRKQRVTYGLGRAGILGSCIVFFG